MHAAVVTAFNQLIAKKDEFLPGMKLAMERAMLTSNSPRVTEIDERLDELEAFLAEQTSEVTEYDEELVRQLIEKITVYDDHLVFEFKSGLETEVQM